MSATAPQCLITINDKTWSENDLRLVEGCSACNKPMQGRIDKTPYCMECGLALMLKPLRIVRSLNREAQL